MEHMASDGPQPECASDSVRSYTLATQSRAWRLAKWGCTTAAALGMMLVETPARADEPMSGPRFVPGWAGDVPVGEIVLGAASVGGLGFYLLPQNKGKWGPDAAHARQATSDAASYGTAFTLPLVVGFSTWLIEGSMLRDARVSAPYARALLPLLIEVESLALAVGLTGAIKSIAGRCRPRSWSNETKMCASDDDEEYAAFPSGHTSLSSALAGTRLVLAIRSNGRLRGLRWVAFGLTEAAAITTAVLRVTAGAHSTSDVAGGWGLGHVVGAGVALMHSTVPIGRIAVGPTGVNWSGTF
jgi:membrane-associated phospholipid phosphatase